MFLRLGKMKKWLESKPRGFGERKDDELVSDEFDDQDGVPVSDAFDNWDDELVSDELDDQDDEFDELELGEGRNNTNATSEAEANDADILETMFNVKLIHLGWNALGLLRKKLLARGKQQSSKRTKRSKIKEKAQLTEVFSKYGLQTPLTSKEES
ncbi:hypothetical protein V6N13_140242 [Hibiscus sabdariffa]